MFNSEGNPKFPPHEAHGERLKRRAVCTDGFAQVVMIARRTNGNRPHGVSQTGAGHFEESFLEGPEFERGQLVFKCRVFSGSYTGKEAFRDLTGSGFGVKTDLGSGGEGYE